MVCLTSNDISENGIVWVHDDYSFEWRGYSTIRKQQWNQPAGLTSLSCFIWGLFGGTCRESEVRFGFSKLHEVLNHRVSLFVVWYHTGSLRNFAIMVPNQPRTKCEPASNSCQKTGSSAALRWKEEKFYMTRVWLKLTNIRHIPFAKWCFSWISATKLLSNGRRADSDIEAFRVRRTRETKATLLCEIPNSAVFSSVSLSQRKRC